MGPREISKTGDLYPSCLLLIETYGTVRHSSITVAEHFGSSSRKWFGNHWSDILSGINISRQLNLLPSRLVVTVGIQPAAP